MVAKSIETKGTVNKITFNIVNKPFDELSSKANELQDKIANINVKAKTILFFKISDNIIFIILFIFLISLKHIET